MRHVDHRGLLQVEQVRFVGREVVARDAAEIGTEQRGEAEVRPDQVVGELVGELRGHVRPRVAAVRAEPLVAELAHQLDPHSCRLAPPDARR
jgi:hypothetical protein